MIAFFYGHGLHVAWLLGACALTLLLYAMNRARLMGGLAYALIGCALWYATRRSGIHATIAGVALGLLIPATAPRPAREVLHELKRYVTDLESKAADEELRAAEILGIDERLEDLEAPAQRMVHALHPVVAFGIMPLFALANSGVSLGHDVLRLLGANVTLGTALGLFVGKQIGIFLTTLAGVKLRLAPMPGRASPVTLYGVSILAGIGFTVALFIAGLAFQDSPEALAEAKLGILLGSLAAGFVGFTILRVTRAR